MAFECLWSDRKHLGNSYWQVKGLKIKPKACEASIRIVSTCNDASQLPLENFRLTQ